MFMCISAVHFITFSNCLAHVCMFNHSQFESIIFSGPFQTSDDMMLMFYSYYKQATQGPCNIPRPTSFWDTRGKAKWQFLHCKSQYVIHNLESSSHSRTAVLSKYPSCFNEMPTKLKLCAVRDAWSSLGNMTKEEAMKNYVEDIQMVNPFKEN